MSNFSWFNVWWKNFTTHKMLMIKKKQKFFQGDAMIYYHLQNKPAAKKATPKRKFYKIDLIWLPIILRLIFECENNRFLYFFGLYHFFVSSVCYQLQGLSQKENKNGTMSPDSPEPDDNYTLTPRTEAKYNKIDEDFQIMMQRNQQLTASGRVNMSNSNYTLPVSVPVIGTYNDSGMLQSSPQMAHNSISPRPSSSETDSGKNRTSF